MPKRFQNIVAIWFIMQIVLPFSAPLQNCDLADILGARHHEGAPAWPETAPTPVTGEAQVFISPLDVSALRASTYLAVIRPLNASGLLMATFGLTPSPQVQQTVLRL